MTEKCEHLVHAPLASPKGRGCEECIQSGGHWVHLRVCLTCGHIGCCDSSPNRHATKHYLATGHPVVQSFEPGETWRWCYVDEQLSS
ncbi:UBP-type zinc finger domain-containing protein [Cupriavidus sp. D39]|uniref:UBP-type zinc finger domain-containing protein n=1 Tax=Cupriavidus sp. D39 TaxID=2997877 RepID=UPI00227091FE|nr:UBP-type zinc finger domain-containing protein [Cupriavidus sp. D39]MCY0852578.1 UBP-type zinc finger domain-containing protein [Cupriavidus sp. D39]